MTTPTNNDSKWDKFFFGFFVVTVLSGLYLIYAKDYLAGISGTIVGLFLIYQQRLNKKTQSP